MCSQPFHEKMIFVSITWSWKIDHWMQPAIVLRQIMLEITDYSQPTWHKSNPVSPLVLALSTESKADDSCSCWEWIRTLKSYHRKAQCRMRQKVIRVALCTPDEEVSSLWIAAVLSPSITEIILRYINAIVIKILKNNKFVCIS